MRIHRGISNTLKIQSFAINFGLKSHSKAIRRICSLPLKYYLPFRMNLHLLRVTRERGGILSRDARPKSLLLLMMMMMILLLLICAP